MQIVFLFYFMFLIFIAEIYSWDLVAHPVTQVIGEQALADILDLSEVAWTCWRCFYTQQWADYFHTAIMLSLIHI